jgi:hypothetical protein
VSPLGIPVRLPLTTDPKIRASIGTPPLGNEVFATAHRDWERRDSEYEARKAERERKHEEWGRKQQEWRDRMRDTLRAKREKASRLREMKQTSLDRTTQANQRPGGSADEIRDSLEDQISDV